ncbi:hypothetical protein [Novosphingobium aquae]|uniref:Uncharacterized protein n=1 Tax=Novosphingobium aquae TaxID=3133435 RepID=A0ABU8S6W4_9SPHN
MIRTTVAIAALLAAPVAVLAKPTPKKPVLLLQGGYRFTSSDFDSVTKKPVCTETWTFNLGKMLVESGEERVEKRFRLITDRTGNWLVAATLSTNGKPDCTGYASATINPDESRIYILPLNSGDFLTCPAPTKTARGIPLIANCFGSLRRIAPTATPR